MSDDHPRHPDEPERTDSTATKSGAPSAGQSQVVGPQSVDPHQDVEEPRVDPAGRRHDEG